MTDAAPLERLQKIADYRTTCKYLSKVGMEGIVFGCIILLLGGNTFGERFLDYLYMGLGVAELLVGVRNRFRPSASGVVLQGILLMLFGVWNLALQALIVQAGGELGWFGTIFGVLLLIIGINQIRRYPRVKEAFEEPPSIEQLNWFDEMVAEIQKAKTDSDDLVEFSSGVDWRAKRLGDMVLVVAMNDMENVVADRHDIEIEDKGKGLFGGNRNVKLRIGTRQFPIASISPAMYDLLESWRVDGDSSEAGDENQQEESDVF